MSFSISGANKRPSSRADTNLLAAAPLFLLRLAIFLLFRFLRLLLFAVFLLLCLFAVLLLLFAAFVFFVVVYVSPVNILRLCVPTTTRSERQASVVLRPDNRVGVWRCVPAGCWYKLE